MSYPITRGSTSVKFRIFIPDNTSTVGAGLSTLTFASTNLAISWTRAGDSTPTEITGANLLTIATIGTWVSPGTGKLRFAPVDTTKFPGLYEIHVPDDSPSFGTGDTSDNVIFNVYEKTTAALHIGPNMHRSPLIAVNFQDATKFGMTRVVANTDQVGGQTVTATAAFNFDDLSIFNGTFIRRNFATAGGPSSITLDAGAPNTTNFYATTLIRIIGGTGAGQPDNIGVSSTTGRVVTVLNPWIVPPDNTSQFLIIKLPQTNVLQLNSVSQTGRDIGASVLLSSGTGTGQVDLTLGIPKVNLVQILGTLLTETVGGYIAAGIKKFFDVAVPTSTMNRITTVDTNGDMRGTDNAATSTDMGTLLSRMTLARAQYLDNLNIGGPTASQASVNAINTSASKHLLLQTVVQMERPESGSTAYTIILRTYNATTGADADADSTPTLTATGNISGSLNVNLSAATHSTTGEYRWTYTVANNATQEQVRFDVAATINSASFTMPALSQVLDEVAQTWTATHAAQLAAVYNKLPANNIADETLVLAAVGTPMQAGAAVTLTSGERTSIGTAVWATTTRALSDKTGFSLSSPEHTAIASDVLNAVASAYNAPGSIGNKINSGGGSGGDVNEWTIESQGYSASDKT